MHIPDITEAEAEAKVGDKPEWKERARKGEKRSYAKGANRCTVPLRTTLLHAAFTLPSSSAVAMTTRRGELPSHFSLSLSTTFIIIILHTLFVSFEDF